MKRDIVYRIDKRYLILVKGYKMNNFNNNHELQFNKIELNHFSYFFHTC